LLIRDSAVLDRLPNSWGPGAPTEGNNAIDVGLWEH